MGKINVLGFDIANLIAAGEVVDRPASVVKELCENALDAGASSVTVEIRHGGTTYIRVSDNGVGIEPEDMPLTVLRHATSKIATAEDLQSIGTLGFRGEALAAIAAVCKMKMRSKTADSEMGCAMTCEGGEIIDLCETGCAKGTTVVATELFYNVPARRKFLKKDASESAAVTAVMEKMALSSPHTAIKYITDGELKFMTSGNGDLKGTIYSVFGKAVAQRMTPVDRTSGEGVRISGYISEPDLVRSNKNSENFFINGRFVKSRTAMAAIEQAYSTRIPTQKFPVCVLNIGINPATVDVNVHPSKLEVKFANERIIFEAVYYAVLNALEASCTRPEFYIPTNSNSKSNSNSNSSSPKALGIPNSPGTAGDSRRAPVQNAFVPVEREDQRPEKAQIKIAETVQYTPAGQTASAEHTVYFSPTDPTAENPTPTENGQISLQAADSAADQTMPPLAEQYRVEPNSDGSSDNKSIFVTNALRHAYIKPTVKTVPEPEPVPAQTPTEKPSADQAVPPMPQHMPQHMPSTAQPTAPETPAAKSTAPGTPNIPEYRIIGEAYNCYVLVELSDRILMIDKHAAHERILFDELCRRMKENKRRGQMLMYPIRLQISDGEKTVLDEYFDKITAIGFGVAYDEKSGEIVVSEIPDELGRDAAESMIGELLSNLAEATGSIETAEAKYFEAKLYQASCKAAIKGGRVYGEQHIKWICDHLLTPPDEKGAVIKTCPHGRPVAFEIKKTSIDRQFDRIN